MSMVGMDFSYATGDVVDVPDDVAEQWLGELAEEADDDEEPTATFGSSESEGSAEDGDEDHAEGHDPDVGQVEAIWAQWVEEFGDPGEGGLDVVVDGHNQQVAIRNGAGPGELYSYGDGYQVDFSPQASSNADELEGMTAKEVLEFAATGPAAAAFARWAEEASERPRATVLRGLPS
jgi:hypothetical protein